MNNEPLDPLSESVLFEAYEHLDQAIALMIPIRDILRRRELSLAITNTEQALQWLATVQLPLVNPFQE